MQAVNAGGGLQGLKIILRGTGDQSLCQRFLLSCGGETHQLLAKLKLLIKP
tara:strand:+ start:185 stop:337 length:153 start_codon:yes stop_codon:yes gene_type:complete